MVEVFITVTIVGVLIGFGSSAYPYLSFYH